MIVTGLCKVIPTFNARGEIKENYNLSHLIWFKVGGPAQVFFKPEDASDLKDLLQQNAAKLPITVLGAGSNTIIRDGGIDGIVIKLGRNFTNIELQGDHIKVGASSLNLNLAKFCLNNSIKGFEFLVGIPGTIGGGVTMNAGAYGKEFKDILANVEVMTYAGEVLNIPASDIKFSYRTANLPQDYIITSAAFKAKRGDSQKISNLMDEINLKRASTQPIKEKTSGSTFANPENYKAWELIDKAGLRGYRIGGASMSELHCNFMINDGSACAKDLEQLGEYVRAQVFEKYGVTLEWEVKRIGKYA